MREKQLFSYDARFLQNTTKGIHSGYLVSKSVHPKMYWLQNGSFVDRCGARKFHSLHLHFEISSQLPPLSSKLALPQTQKWLVAKYQYFSSRDQRQKHQGMHSACLVYISPNLDHHLRTRTRFLSKNRWVIKDVVIKYMKIAIILMTEEMVECRMRGWQYNYWILQ